MTASWRQLLSFIIGDDLKKIRVIDRQPFGTIIGYSPFCNILPVSIIIRGILIVNF